MQAYPAATGRGQEALHRLQIGNARFATGEALSADTCPASRARLIDGQHPFAAVLACSDSRVPPEHVFDCGLGELFVVRVAGNVVQDATLASLEYAVGHLHVPMLLVLGHENCGAVAAAIHTAREGCCREPGVLPGLIGSIEPAVTACDCSHGDMLSETVTLKNVERCRELIGRSPVVDRAVREEQLLIASGYYELGTGRVRWL